MTSNEENIFVGDPDENLDNQLDQQSWLAAKPTTRKGNEEVPQGTYQCRLMRIRRGQRTTPKGEIEDYLSFGFRIVSGNYNGRWLWKYQPISSTGWTPEKRKEVYGYIQADLERCGIPIPKSVSSLTATIQAAIDDMENPIFAEIRKAPPNKPGYQDRIWIQRRIQLDASVGLDTGNESYENEEEIPF